MLKILALLAGAAGIAGFFLPLAEYRDPTGKVMRTASPYEIATTETDPDAIAEFAKGLGASQDQADQIAETANTSLLAYRGAIIAFYIPAALQALFALINLVRSRMGRVMGFLAILLGTANGAVFAYFYIGAAKSTDPNASLGYGVWALAVAGALGILAGLLTMFAPDND